MGHVAADSLFGEPRKGSVDRLEVIRKQIDTLLAASTDATPATNQRGAAEQIRFDRHGVKTCHVFSGVDSLNIQAEPVLGHAPKIRRARFSCPTTCTNL